MRLRDRTSRAWIALTGLALLLLGCATPAFNPEDYQTAVALKYETLTLIDKGSRSYSRHKSEAEALTEKIGEAHTASARVVNNQQVEQQWQFIRNPDGSSAGAVLALWKKRGALRSSYRAEKRKQVAAHYDYLICLESSKQSATECKNPASTTTAADTTPAEEKKPERTPTPKPRPAAQAANAENPPAEQKPQAQ